MHVRNWEKSGFAGPHLAGTAEPTGAVGLACAAGPPGEAGPAPHHVLEPRQPSLPQTHLGWMGCVGVMSV
jgi:hypothetical protein